MSEFRIQYELLIRRDCLLAAIESVCRKSHVGEVDTLKAMVVTLGLDRERLLRERVKAATESPVVFMEHL